jgi:hypothetical protein
MRCAYCGSVTGLGAAGSIPPVTTQRSEFFERSSAAYRITTRLKLPLQMTELSVDVLRYALEPAAAFLGKLFAAANDR